MEKTGDFYDLLGLHQEASGEEIRARYHELALLFHPDRAKDADKETAHRVFVRINQAYRTLIDPEQRKRYDLRREGRSAGQPLAGGAIAAEPSPEFHATDDEIREWMGAAAEAFRRGDLQAAHAFCRRIIKSGHGPVEAYILIGDVYVGEREKAKALTAYQVALKMQPQNKMVEAKVRRLEELLSGHASQDKPTSGLPADVPEGRRSFLSRLNEIRGKKQT